MTELLDGVTVKIGRREFIVPPLNIKSLKRAAKLAPVMEGGGEESFDACVDVIHMAVVRNYPDVTRDELEEELDSTNLPTVVNAVLEASGYDPKAVAQAMAGSPAAGTPSTPDSSAPPDGAGSTSTST